MNKRSNKFLCNIFFFIRWEILYYVQGTVEVLVNQPKVQFEFVQESHILNNPSTRA